MSDGPAMSNTALARKMLIEFWSDQQPHSVRDFRNYLQEKNILAVDHTHISSAVYTATHQGVLERVDRGNYQAGVNFNGDMEFPEKRVAGIRYVLQQTKYALSIPVNITGLNSKEMELIPRLQELYQECEKMIEELEEDEHEVS